MFTFRKKNDPFFELFNRGTTIMVQTAEAFLVLLSDPTHAAEHAETIEELEHQGDLNTHATMERLYKSFITPIDRAENLIYIPMERATCKTRNPNT